MTEIESKVKYKSDTVTRTGQAIGAIAVAVAFGYLLRSEVSDKASLAIMALPVTGLSAIVSGALVSDIRLFRKDTANLAVYLKSKGNELKNLYDKLRR